MIHRPPKPTNKSFLRTAKIRGRRLPRISATVEGNPMGTVHALTPGETAIITEAEDAYLATLASPESAARAACTPEFSGR
jgi:hypothetical protein